jgi:hypothetical protein
MGRNTMMQYKISLIESFRNTLNQLDSLVIESDREIVDEYLTSDEKAQVDQWERRTPQATKATDPFFGAGNDEINEPLVGGKSDIHRAIEQDVGIEIPPESYKSGILKDKSGKQQRIGTLISEPSLRNAFKTDNTRKNVKTNDLSVTTTRSPHGVAGQTSHGQSWEQASCKNFNDGSKRHYLCQEVKHGTVVVYLKDKDGTELARATLQPYINKQGVYQYRLNGFYGDKNSTFVKYIKHLEQKLSHEHSGDGRYDIHPEVYNDSGNRYTLPYDEGAIKDALSKDGMALKYVPKETLRQHPELCKIAIKQNWESVQYVPEELRTQEIYRLAADSMKKLSEID